MSRICSVCGSDAYNHDLTHGGRRCVALRELRQQQKEDGHELGSLRGRIAELEKELDRGLCNQWNAHVTHLKLRHGVAEDPRECDRCKGCDASVAENTGEPHGQNDVSGTPRQPVTPGAGEYLCDKCGASWEGADGICCCEQPDAPAPENWAKSGKEWIEEKQDELYAPPDPSTLERVREKLHTLFTDAVLMDMIVDALRPILRTAPLVWPSGFEKALKEKHDKEVEPRDWGWEKSSIFHMGARWAEKWLRQQPDAPAPDKMLDEHMQERPPLIFPDEVEYCDAYAEQEQDDDGWFRRGVLWAYHWLRPRVQPKMTREGYEGLVTQVYETTGCEPDDIRVVLDALISEGALPEVEG